MNPHNKLTQLDFINKANIIHTNKSGCPRCKMSKGESIIRNYLISNTIKFEEQKTFLQ